MSLTIAQIAQAAFDGVVSAIDGVIKPAIIRRNNVADYNTDTGAVATEPQQQACRLVFAGSGAGRKYLPDITVVPPEEIVFVAIAGVAAMSPKDNDDLYVDNVCWHICQPVRDIVQGGGLWAAVVRPA